MTSLSKNKPSNKGKNMKLNYIPGIPYRFYPGLTRDYVQSQPDLVHNNCKLVIMTGDTPTETELWNLSNLNTFLAANTDKIVYQETTQLQFRYEGALHKRIIQRYPIDSKKITTLVASIAKTGAAGTINTVNSLYALVYCPDLDATQNTVGNDLVLLIPSVGTGLDDYLSLSKVNFTAGEEITLRNMTISVFQGYQNTDTPITELQEDPENPGQQIEVIVDTVKSVYFNKVWGNRIAESFRDCVIPKRASTNGRDSVQYILDGLTFVPYYKNASNVYVSAAATWNSTYYNGFLVTEAFVSLIDEINYRNQVGSLPNFDACMNNTGTTLGSYVGQMGNGSYASQNINDSATISAYGVTYNSVVDILIKELTQQSIVPERLNAVTAYMVDVMGFDADLISRVKKCIIPLIIDYTKYTYVFNKETGICTMQYPDPIKLYRRYKKTQDNPTNEKLYIYLPRLNDQYKLEGVNTLTVIYIAETFIPAFSSTSNPLFVETQLVMDGVVPTSSTPKKKFIDYTAVSIGLTGNGATDLEYDILDIIDYIDSFAVMMKIPRKY